MDVQLVPLLTNDLQESIHALLREYNQASNPNHFDARALPEHAPRPLNVVALDAQGEVLGGLIGETQLSWLKVSIMAVAVAQRRRGLGSRLLELAEQEAATRGCRYAYVDTMNYQSPDFYEKLGYHVAGKLEDWDSHGHIKYFFTKQLSPRAIGSE
jgi:ribosomal protein S18 acetylase RimI-like enzyme